MTRIRLGTGRAGTRPSIREYFRMVWSYGDVWSRCFVVFFITALVAIILASVWTAWALLARSIPFELGLSIAIAEASGGIYLPLWVGPLYNPNVINEGLRRGWLTSPGYFNELVRYLGTFGVRDRLRGTIEWGLSAWGVYYLMIVAAIPITSSFIPMLGDLALYTFLAIDAAVSIGFVAIAGRGGRGRLLEAQRRGFSLIELYPKRRRRRLN